MITETIIFTKGFSQFELPMAYHNPKFAIIGKTILITNGASQSKPPRAYHIRVLAYQSWVQPIQATQVHLIQVLVYQFRIIPVYHMDGQNQ